MWNKFFKVDMEPLTGFGFQFDDEDDDNFFINEENNVVMIFSLQEFESYSTSYIMGDNVYIKIVDLHKVLNPQECEDCFSPLGTLALMYQSIMWKCLTEHILYPSLIDEFCMKLT